MATFGKKLRECKDDKGMSQQELAKVLKISHPVIGRYERDEMKPPIDVVKKLADVPDTTVGYLLGEVKETQLLKDPIMLKRFNEINELPDKDKECVYTLPDAFLAKNKMQAILK